MMCAATLLRLSFALMPLTAVPQDAGHPGPLSGRGGIAGFYSVSRIVFPPDGEGSGDGRAHRLEAVYLFPGRARWRLLPIDGRASERLLVYRFGEQAHQLLPGRSASSIFRGPSLAKTILQMELRRAAMTWPHGFAWEQAGRTHTAAVKASPAAERKLGTLSATLGKDGRPSRIQARDTRGNEVETITIDTWQELRERWWPRRLSLSEHGRAVWTETIETVETRVYFVDTFFQPPDRRGTLPTTLQGGTQVLSLDLQGITFRRRKLEPDCSWATALELAATWIEEAGAASGLQLDRTATLELDHGGRPTHVILRLAARDDTPPAGWATIPDRPGLALVVDDLAALDARLLATLTAAAPPDARPGPPYCRVVERENGPQIQVYLPY